MTKNAKVAIVAVIGAICVTFLFSAMAFRPLGQLRHQLDLIAQRRIRTREAAAPSQSRPPTNCRSWRRRSTCSGQRLRGAQFEVSDLRGNIDRLLQDLEDAVFIFNRERRLVFASGSVEKFLGKERE